MTGEMLPILQARDWQVETVEIDLGDGLREWIEIRHGTDPPRYVVTVVDRDRVLREHGVDPAALVDIDVIDDGCE